MRMPRPGNVKKPSIVPALTGDLAGGGLFFVTIARATLDECKRSGSAIRFVDLLAHLIVVVLRLYVCDPKAFSMCNNIERSAARSSSGFMKLVRL